MEKVLNYNQAPLPFQGQKRRFLTLFKRCLNDMPEQATYVDLFGGSGLLSHTMGYSNPFKGAIKYDYKTTLNHSSSYTDIMLVKKGGTGE